MWWLRTCDQRHVVPESADGAAHSLTRSQTHSYSLSHTHSLTHSLTHSSGLADLRCHSFDFIDFADLGKVFNQILSQFLVINRRVRDEHGSRVPALELIPFFETPSLTLNLGANAVISRQQTH